MLFSTKSINHGIHPLHNFRRVSLRRVVAVDSSKELKTEDDKNRYVPIQLGYDDIASYGLVHLVQLLQLDN